MQREEAEVWSKLGCPTCHRVGAGVRASPGAIRHGAADRESLSSRGWPAPSCSTQDAGKRTAVLRRPALLLTQSHKKKKTQCVRNKVPKVTSDSRFALPNLLLRKCQHKQLTQMVNHTVLLQPLSSDTILQEESPRGHWVITLIGSPHVSTDPLLRKVWYRKGDAFQGPRVGSCLTLGNELSEETHVLIKQETLLGRSAWEESSGCHNSPEGSYLRCQREKIQLQRN
ncbi:uncharacterized protein [Pseudorca crassidens]|uniref:uncharacterized protein isoform X1 n=1 Tax=Pseudorca crassidens TaxID=82174 RepID=UPI00352FB4D5